MGRHEKSKAMSHPWGSASVATGSDHLARSGKHYARAILELCAPHNRRSWFPLLKPGESHNTRSHGPSTLPDMRNLDFSKMRLSPSPSVPGERLYRYVSVAAVRGQ